MNTCLLHDQLSEWISSSPKGQIKSARERRGSLDEHIGLSEASIRPGLDSRTNWWAISDIQDALEAHRISHGPMLLLSGLVLPGPGS